MLNLAMLLDDAARKYPEREAVVAGPQRLTYQQLDRLACQVANGLRGKGIQPGDRVALSCPNLAYFPIVYYGILKSGAVVVPLNVLLKGHEIAYHLQDSGAKAYFCFEGTAELPMAQAGDDGMRQATSCEHFFVITADPVAPSPIAGTETLSQFMVGQPSSFETVYRAADDTAVILYTSGTTGRAKGAELMHRNMLMNAMIARNLDMKLIDAREQSVSLITLPLFHSFGQTSQMNSAVYHAGKVVLVPRFDPATVLSLMEREKVTLFAGVPTMYWGLLNYVRQNGLDPSGAAEHLVLCVSGGASMPVELMRDFEQTFGVTILEGYGLSETSPVATFTHSDMPRKPGSIGVPIFGCEVRVVDENDVEVPRNQPGEIVIRGHNIMKGYINKPEATAEAMRGGWFHTGDIGRMDEDGYLFIMDRLKDMVIRGGFNVYPREIEELLHQHPAVSLAAVVGVPHEEVGEEIKAYVVLRPAVQLEEKELVAWCKERLAAYKYPRLVEFRDALPMNATGKILKRELRSG